MNTHVANEWGGNTTGEWANYENWSVGEPVENTDLFFNYVGVPNHLTDGPGGDFYIQTLNMVNGDEGNDFAVENLYVEDGLRLGPGWSAITVASIDGDIPDLGNEGYQLILTNQTGTLTIHAYFNDRVIVNDGNGSITFTRDQALNFGDGTQTFIAEAGVEVDCLGGDASLYTLDISQGGTFVNYTGTPTIVSEAAPAPEKKDDTLAKDILLLLD